jgi:hypothetical protein
MIMMVFKIGVDSECDRALVENCGGKDLDAAPR